MLAGASRRNNIRNGQLEILFGLSILIIYLIPLTGPFIYSFRTTRFTLLLCIFKAPQDTQ